MVRQSYELKGCLQSLSVFDQYLGVVTADEELLITQAGNRLVQLPLNQLRECFEQAIPRRMGLDFSSSV